MSVQNSTTEARSEFQQAIAELVQQWEDEQAARPDGHCAKLPQHETRIMPAAADIVAMAEHYGTAFVEEDGWVNTLLRFPGGSTVVYKAPTDAAVS